MREYGLHAMPQRAELMVNSARLPVYSHLYPTQSLSQPTAGITTAIPIM
jgi:hypothetical protein